MTALAQLLAGGRLTAAGAQGIAPNAVIKGADEPVTSSTTLQNDDALLLGLGSNTQWFFAAMINYTGDTTGSGGIKFTFTTPAGSTLTWSQLYMPSSVSAPDLSGSGTGSGQARSAVTGGTTTQVPIWVLGSVIMGSTAGNLQLQWAQNASDAVATTVKAGSFLAAWQVA